MIQSEVVLSDAHLLEGLRRHQDLKFTRKAVFAFKGVCLAALLGIAGVMFFGVKSIWGGLLMLGFGVLLIFSRAVDRWILRYRFRKSPYRDRRVKIEFADEGLRTTSELADSVIRWEAYSRAVRVQTGFLLYQGPNAFTWLPATSFERSANLDAVAECFRRNVKEYADRT